MKLGARLIGEKRAVYSPCLSPLVLTISVVVLLAVLTSVVIAAVTIADFSVEAGTDRVFVFWETGSEIGNLGFYIWRSESQNAGYQKIPIGGTPQFIPSDDFGIGAQYTFEDLQATPYVLYYYKVQDIPANGTTGELVGPLAAGIGITLTPTPSPTPTATPTTTRRPGTRVPDTATPTRPLSEPSATPTPTAKATAAITSSPTPTPETVTSPANTVTPNPTPKLAASATPGAGESPVTATRNAPEPTVTSASQSPTPLPSESAATPESMATVSSDGLPLASPTVEVVSGATPVGDMTPEPEVTPAPGTATPVVVEGADVRRPILGWLWLFGLLGLGLVIAGIWLWRRG